jgi:type I restriction enzyme, S subunit
MNSMEGWETKRFDEIGEIFSGSTPSTSIRAYWDGEIVWVTPNDLSKLITPYLSDSAKRITEKGLNGCSANLLPARSIILSSRAPIGYVAIPSVEFCTNQGCKSIKLRKEFNTEFVYYNITFNIDKVKNLGEGTTFAEISKTALSTIELDFPTSLSEQTQIAEILSTVDRAIEQTEALIAKQQRIKTGLMQDLLTRGIDDHGNLRSEETHEFKDSPLGRIPVEWDVVQTDEMCGAIVDCPHTTPNYVEGGVPCIRTADMQPGHLLLSTAYCVDEPTYQNRVARLIPQKGDIIYSREGERLGIASPVGNERVCLGQRVMLLRPAPGIDPDYLLWSMNAADFYLQSVSGLGATTSPHINVADVRHTLIRRPLTSEQVSIGSHLAAQHNQLRATIDGLSKLRYLKTALMQDLLTGKKRVTALLNNTEASH